MKKYALFKSFCEREIVGTIELDDEFVSMINEFYTKRIPIALKPFVLEGEEEKGNVEGFFLIIP